MTTAAPSTHDRVKTREVDAAAEYLVALGVTTADGKPRPGMAAKLRQIERFVQTISSLVGSAPDPSSDSAPPSLRVCDVGCGRGYLTFASHAHLVKAGWAVSTQGVELRPPVVQEVEGIARRLGSDFDGLRFSVGAIATMLPMPKEATGQATASTSFEDPSEDGVDVLIALHACDTATDDAIWCGIVRGARVIVTAPCCQKEVRRQLDPFLARGDTDHVLDPMLRHGIFRERTAEMVTDSLRASLLELAGYDVKVFEFIGGEHTAKNVIIAATRRAVPRSAAGLSAIRKQLLQQLALFGVKRQRLAEWMNVLPRP
mmetsp:Transcript_58737/g.130912  ORF Transcript_58737/g.130912 Transcript_58737/m.130912 type:complete len:315 (-) Transcript_58737:281-1225(-)